MIGKLIATTVLLLLALYAFWGNALGAGYLINPFGILFLFLAAVTWFKWEAIREGFRAAKDESNIPIIRLNSKVIGGMFSMRRAPPQRRSSSN
jgi:hypothetical protein